MLLFLISKEGGKEVRNFNGGEEVLDMCCVVFGWRDFFFLGGFHERKYFCT